MDSNASPTSDLDPLRPSPNSKEARHGHGGNDIRKGLLYGHEDSIDAVTQEASCKSPNVRLKRKRALDQGPLAIICRWIIAHQIGLAANLLLLHAMTHVCFPRARQSTRKFHTLSYHNPTTGRYALGWDDVYMVWYSMIVLTGLRAATMEYVLVPLAQMAGVRTKKEQVRFSEQGWVLIYDTTFFCLGTYIMYTHEYWLNLKGLWTDWPNREVEGAMKWYYLVQFAFWIQQIFVVNIEERRKDHWQMLTHHFITCGLMFTSYCYHQTKVGNVILVLMELVDLLLAFAKILKYLKFQLACDIAFGVFMIGWFIARHIIFLMVVHSVYKDSPVRIRTGCYSGSSENLAGPFELDSWTRYLEPFTNSQGVICWNAKISNLFVSTLMALQVILCIWFGMIVKVAAKVLKGGEAVDSRSDDEAEDEEEDECQDDDADADSKKKSRGHHQQQPIELPPLEEEVGVESINLSNSHHHHNPNRRYRKSGTVASGVNLHSDRKELLGRIGCDKMGE